MLIENGDIVRFDEHGATVAGKAPVGRVLIDASGAGEVIDEVLRDRRHLAEDGVVVPVVAINKQTGASKAIQTWSAGVSSRMRRAPSCCARA